MMHPTGPDESSRRSAKDRILDTAERLFAEHGVGGVSIRDITQEAEVNLAAISYYFGNKQGLVAAVFNRRLAPLNQQRLAMLEEAEQQSDGKPLKLEAILEALIGPAVDQGFAQSPHNKSFLQLIGRCLSEPNEETEAIFRKHAADLVNRFNKAFLLTMPGLSREELDWRMRFVIGALHYALLACADQGSWPVKLEKKLDAAGLTERLVAFAAAGLKAAVAERGIANPIR